MDAGTWIGWFQEVFTRQTIIDSLTDLRTVFVPVLILFLFWHKVGSFKAILLSLLSFMVLLATWHEIVLDDSSERIMILCGLSGMLGFYFIYLLLLKSEVRD